ncbi:MAG: hypothetical protein L3I99_07090 [Sulfurimonas sp.]|nr:hypothetical protein [Sulfurimonas sp.]
MIFATLVHSHNYDQLLLKAQASIFPKIVLLDKKLNEKLVDGKIIYTIAYEEEDYFTAQEIAKYMKINFKENFDKYNYKVNLIKFSNLSYDMNTTVIYALNSNENIQKVANIAKKKGIITFSYDINNLKNGLLFSLMLEKTTVLYLNKENLDNEKIDFIDSLLQMVNFID